MIKHIVMWKLKDSTPEGSKPQNAVHMKALLDECANCVQGMLAFDVVIAQPHLEATYDVLLYSEFATSNDLAAYNAHPKHLALKGFIGSVREARQCMDYEITDAVLHGTE